MGDIVRRVSRGKFIGWYLRYKDVDGRRKQRASHQPTRALASRLLVEIEARVIRGLVGLPTATPPAATLRVDELCERFLREFASPRIKDLVRYRASARTALARLLPQLGHLPLIDLERRHLEKARDALARTFMPNTVRATLAPLGTALNWAVRQGLLSRSPARGLELPRRELSTEYLSGEEASRLLATAQQHADQSGHLAAGARFIALSLALRLGLRRGEIFGLRWQDVEPAAARLTVAKSYRLAPKNGKARHLPLPAFLTALLQSWRPRCPPTAENLVCPVLYAGRWGMSSRRASHGLGKLLRAAGCKPLVRGWHSLRHTFASQFVMAGGSLVTLQKLLGHTSMEMTLVYSHLAPEFVALEVERLKY